MSERVWNGALPSAVACVAVAWAGIAWVARGAEPEAAPQAKPAENPQEAQQREQLKQLTTHWEQQLVKVLHAYLELIRSRCGDLPLETRRAIGQSGQQAMKEGAVEAARAQLGGNQQRRVKVVIRNGRQPANPDAQPPKPQADPLDRIAAALEKALAERVGAAEAAAFAAEVAAQRERRKQASVEICVAMLDGQLFLTAAQREAIGRSLLEKWQDGMAMSLHQVHINNGRMVFPGVPPDCVVPHLDEAQRQAFGAPGNVQFGNGGVVPSLQMLGRVQTQLPRDPWWFP